MDNFESLTFVNASGQEVFLSNPDITRWWELRGRAGFTAPDIDIITQKYANGVTRILRRMLKPRTVTVNMVVTGASTAERDTVFFEMVSRLMDVDGGNTGKLYVRRSDGSVVYLNCTYSSGLSIVEEYRKFHRFTLEFYAPDPYFYKDLEEATISVHEGNYLTLSDTILFGTRRIGDFISEGSGVINNPSTENLQPVIRLEGVNGGLTIMNTDSGKSLVLAGLAMTSGQVLVIDTRDDSKNVYIENPDGTTQQAGQYVVYANTKYEFPIVPGINRINYVGSYGSVIQRLEFYMAQRFLSA